MEGDSELIVPRAPVGALSDSDSVDTLVDTSETLLAVDLSKESPRRGRLDAGSRDLVTRDLGRLHTRRETCGASSAVAPRGGPRITHTHRGVCLGDSAGHTTQQSGNSRVDAHAKRLLLDLGRGEDEDGTLGGCFDPCLGRHQLITVENGDGGGNAPME